MDKPLAEMLSNLEPKVIQTIFELLEPDTDTHLYLEEIANQSHDTESPIERMLLAALLLKASSLNNYWLDVWCQYSDFPMKTYYRCDFKVSIDNVGDLSTDKCKSADVLVECDGHDFHEKTKAQVEYRNKRDLELKKAGYDILHFSGSQIYKDPIKCANEIIDYLIIKAEGKGNNGRT